MGLFGNILWFLLGGLIVALMYFAAGLLMCITIIGAPFGVQLFKLGALALFPFGKEVRDNHYRNSLCKAAFQTDEDELHAFRHEHKLKNYIRNAALEALGAWGE